MTLLAKNESLLLPRLIQKGEIERQLYQPGLYESLDSASEPEKTLLDNSHLSYQLPIMVSIEGTSPTISPLGITDPSEV